MKKIAFLMIAGIIFLAGCEQKRPDPVPHEKVEGAVATNLPNHPVFETVLEQTEPNKKVYTAWGAIFHQEDLFDKEIRVTGVITEVSTDCPQYTAPRVKSKKKGAAPEAEAPAPQAAHKCHGIYFKMATPTHKQRAIEVVGYHPYYHPHLEVGMEVDVTGKYVKVANTMGRGYVQFRDGVLLTKEIHNMGLDRSGNFSTDRNEISAMITQRTILNAPKNY